jgi:hypothetical protein
MGSHAAAGIDNLYLAVCLTNIIARKHFYDFSRRAAFPQ